MNNVVKTFAAACILMGASTVAAQADSCSGRDHTTGTVLGAVGGGLIGSAVTRGSAGGVVGGAVLGGLAGNQIARSSDCRRPVVRTRRVAQVYYDRAGHRHVRYVYVRR